MTGIAAALVTQQRGVATARQPWLLSAILAILSRQAPTPFVSLEVLPLMHHASPSPIILGAMLTGSGAPDDERAWLDDQEPVDASINPEWYSKIAQQLDGAGVSFLFIADAVFADPDGPPHYLSRFEPLSLLSFLAAQTRRIGLVGTFSTSYNEPYNLARQLMSLDHLSRGRCGWNLVTSLGDRAARNFGLDSQRDHRTRYARAEEFVSVVRGLWHSYAPDALPRDRRSGRYIDKEKITALNHHGDFFTVAGPLNIEPSCQREPVIFQAGQSTHGQQLAARSADVVFGMQTDIDAALAYRASLAHYQQQAGVERRAPLLLMKLILHITSDDVSPEQAFTDYATQHRVLDELRDRVARAIQRSLAAPEADLSPISDADIANAHANEGTWLYEPLRACQQRSVSMGEALHQLFRLKALVFAGSASHIAEQMHAWQRSGAADGFIIQISSQRGARDLAERLLPELRRRGLFPSFSDQPCTLRQTLALAEPQLHH
ncbi:putative monooxygenase MoxC [Carnimonas sp. R-84865]